MSEPLDLDVSVPVLVLKIGRYIIHHGVLGILRSLGRLGVPVYVIVPNRFAPVAISRYATRTFLWDTTDLSRDELLDGVVAIGERIGRRAILVPADDSSAAFVGECSSELSRWFLFPKVAPPLPRRLTNKKDLHFLCKNFGVPCPEAVFPASLDEVLDYVRRAVFPVVIKAADAQRLPKGARSTIIARNRDELIEIYTHSESPENPNLIFQEYIPQSCSEDWIFQGYINAQSGSLLTFTGKKLRSYPPFAGITSLGVSIENESLRRQTESLLRAVGYSGIMDIDCRLDRRDGKYKMLDFNPRIGANFRMFENQSGIDVVRALHLDLTRRPLRPSAMVARKFVAEPYDAAAALYHFRRSELSLKSWWNSLRGRRERACFDGRDPLPFLAMCGAWLMRAMRAGGRKFRSHARREDRQLAAAAHAANGRLR